ncbi:MAG: 30S ribosomal protein S16 [Coriobacteriia bacterium]|nr:30S ribosomal protein S16 [Coriobacteriia bacterium]
MAVKIRLARHGAKKAPYYRIVVADSRAPRDGRLIEEVGRYNPGAEPKFLELNMERIDEWIANGAQTSDTVARLIQFYKEGQPQKEEAPKLSKKAKAKAQAQEDAQSEEAQGEE